MAGMNQQNRVNPMMIILRQTSERTAELSQKAIKRFIICLIVSILCTAAVVALSAIFWIRYMICPIVYLIMHWIYLLWDYYKLREQIMHNLTREVNNMVYSDQYANLNLNLEDVYAMTRAASKVNGVLEEKIRVMMPVCIIRMCADLLTVILMIIFF